MMIDNETNVRRLAITFAEVLKSRMSEDEFKEMKRRNANTQQAKCCASHDFCDSNLAMIEALRNLGIEFNLDDADQWILINKAWLLARSEKMI